ncbi:MAG: hypothetical protein AAF081_14710 [Actinomycetota bacterium]
MQPHLPTPDLELDEFIIDLDLTDEDGLLAEDFAERNPQGTRALLAALNLRIPGAPSASAVEVFDMAVYRATGDRHLATIFGKAA